MLYTATKGKKEIIAVTDQHGLFNVINTNSALGFKSFKNFEEVKANYKCFSKIEEMALINYDLSFQDFVGQFEDASKECNSLDVEIKKWKGFRKKLKTMKGK